MAYNIGNFGDIRKLDNTDSPVLNLQFNGDLDDSSGNGFDASRSSGGKDSFGVTANGLRYLILDGTSAYKVGNQTALELTGDMTAIVGLCLHYVEHGSSTGNYQTLIRMRSAGASSANNALYMAYLAHDNSQVYYPAWYQEHGTQDATNGTFSDASLGVVQDGQWFVLAMRRASNVVSFHINGRKVAESGSLTASTGGTSSELWIGETEGNTQRLFGGLNQLLIYGSALTDAVIADRTHEMIGYLSGT